MLKLVSSIPEFFAHAGHSAVHDGAGFGCSCAECGRPVSAPFGYERSLVWCLYCGFEAGFVPLVEHPPGSHRWSFGITREECLQDRAALDQGDFETTVESRARRAGRMVDLF